MRVVCINNKPIYGFNLTNIGLEKIEEGKTYEVTNFEMTPNGFGKYDLKGIINKDGYSVLRFIPVSDIDETELIRERQKQLA